MSGRIGPAGHAPGSPVATTPATDAPVGRTRQPGSPLRALVPYFLVGIAFGIVMTKGEVISWFRIQEMFRFQGWHMYGIFATALPVAIVSVQWIKHAGVRARGGEPITIPPKKWGTGARYAIGGVVFGMGWAITGACPGPLFALLGTGVATIAVALVAAMAGTWTYAALRPSLPH